MQVASSLTNVESKQHPQSLWHYACGVYYLQAQGVVVSPLAKGLEVAICAIPSLKPKQ